MSASKYGKTVRVPGELYDKVVESAQKCGVPVGSFIAEALEDVIAGFEAKSSIRPRCIAKAAAHQSDPVVSPPKATAGSGKVKGKQFQVNRVLTT